MSDVRHHVSSSSQNRTCEPAAAFPEPAQRDNATVVDNGAWAGASPRFSVLIPCYRDEPAPLLRALDRPDLPLEIVLLDDGSGDPALADRLATIILELGIPARFIRLSANGGRAKGRNRLADASRGEFLLFLDADMLPDEADFLDRWLGLIEVEAPAVAFGGYTLLQAPATPATAVCRALASRSNCLPAEARRLSPEKYVFTSNLLIRRDVFEAEPFDQGFAGWGWEDVEWGVRVSRRHQIHHIDIPATHLGLDLAADLAAKYEQSPPNFARFAAMHPDVAANYPSYRTARLLRRAPLLRHWRPWLKRLGLNDAAPVGLRAFALRLYRAALCAEAV